MDSHARAVSETLIRKGTLPIRWFSEELLLKQRITQKITSQGEHSITITGENNDSLSEVDIVWYRRAGHAYLPKSIEPADQKFVETENHMHMTSLWLTLGESAKWVNPFPSFQKSNSKVLQLREATRIGLNIPETLISNDKKAIIDFIHTNKPSAILYKTFFPPIWEEGNARYNFYTVAITTEMLPNDSIIALTPGIYQKIIKKKFEVRITFFGNEYVGVKIHNVNELDWRTLNPYVQLKLSPFKIPSEIEKQCQELMGKLGIVFGCFDFIVTPNDEFIFLEVNEMGQFLWIEAHSSPHFMNS